MKERLLYIQAYFFLLVVLAVVLFSSIVGIFYGIEKNFTTYIWSGVIVSFLALSFEILVSYRFYKEIKNFKVKRQKRDQS